MNHDEMIRHLILVISEDDPTLSDSDVAHLCNIIVMRVAQFLDRAPSHLSDIEVSEIFSNEVPGPATIVSEIDPEAEWIQIPEGIVTPEVVAQLRREVTKLKEGSYNPLEHTYPQGSA